MTTTMISRNTAGSSTEEPVLETKPIMLQSPSMSKSKTGIIRLRDFARSAPVVHEDSLCKDLLEMFQEQGDCECIVMVSNSGNISGLAMRNRFSYKLAHRYSVALFYNKPALGLSDTAPIIVDIDSDPREIIDLAMSRQGDSLYDCIVLVSNRGYEGVLAVSDLLRLSKELQLQAMEAQKETLLSAKERINGIDEAVESVRDSVQFGDTLSMRMVDLTLQGKTELNSIKESFQSIENSSVRQAERMKELERETGSISAVSKLIKELAEQCNILAINASIEAARAGQYGRGFSVVAGEIMNLADQTKKSAIEITAITNNIVQSIVKAVELVEAGRRQTASSVNSVEAADIVFQEIFKSAADNRASSQTIGELAEKAHELSAQVSQEMERLRQTYS
jgi:methyl-accepting chemotaxis protein